MILKDALKIMFDRIARNIGVKESITDALGNSWKELPDIQFSIRNAKKAFDENHLLKVPPPQIEIKQYLNDFADEITRAGRATHDICHCGATLPDHVFSVFVSFLIKYIELETGMEIKIVVEKSSSDAPPQVINEFMHYYPSNN